MKGFKKQELEEQGFMGRLFGSKPQQNAFAEINNILTEAKSAQELTKDPYIFDFTELTEAANSATPIWTSAAPFTARLPTTLFQARRARTTLF